MTTIIKLGGAVCGDPVAVGHLADHLKTLHGAVVLVHGAGPQLDRALAALGEPQVKVDGLRATSVAAAAVVQATMDQAGRTLQASLAQHGIESKHVDSSHRALAGQVKRASGIDLGRVGTATGFDGKDLPVDGITIVTPVGWDEAGPLNVNADEGAVAIAIGIHATRLVLATDVHAVRGADGADIDRLTVAEADALIEAGVALGGMIPKLRNAMQALAGGVGEVLIGDVPGVFDGEGTRVAAALVVA